MPTAEVCRKQGISSATFYKWKARYGGLEVSDARKLKALGDENSKLKNLLAEAMLYNAILKDVEEKSDARREAGSCRFANVEAGNVLWGPAGPCLFLIGPMNAGAWTLSATLLPMDAGSGFWLRSMTIRGNAWHLLRIPPCLAFGLLGSWTSSSRDAESPTRSCLIAERSSPRWPF